MTLRMLYDSDHRPGWRRAPACWDSNRLCCPGCGDPSGLHHGSVTVFHRPVEDGDGVQTIVDDATARMVPVSTDGMPGRRGSLVVEFTCECCHGNGTYGQRNDDESDVPAFEPWRLEICQHKGSTCFEWLLPASFRGPGVSEAGFGRHG